MSKEPVTEQTSVSKLEDVEQTDDVNSLVDFFKRNRVPKTLAMKLLAPYPDRWIEWHNDGKTKVGANKYAINVSPYVSGARVLIRLNSILGPGGWGFKIKDVITTHVTADAIDGDAIPHHLLGALTYASVVGCFSIPGYQESCDIGEHSANWGDKDKKNKSLGKQLKRPASIKNAQTDAIKRSARHYGIGLYLWLTPPLRVDNYYKIPDSFIQTVQATGTKIRDYIIKEVYEEDSE